jgi:hypothetical protein
LLLNLLSSFFSLKKSQFRAGSFFFFLPFLFLLSQEVVI